MPKFTVVTTVVERRSIEAATVEEAFEINNNADSADGNVSIEVPDRYAVDESGKQFREEL